MAFMCRLSGHYMPRLMTIAAKRLSPLPKSPVQPNSGSNPTATRIASHTAKDADNDDNNRTFSHLQLKAGRFKICGGGCRGGKSCCIICPLGALCIAPYKKISSGALRVRFVSRSTSFRIFFFSGQFFVIFCAVYMIYLFCVSLLLLLMIVLFIVQLPRL